jgi:hypothetical protein
MCETSALHKDNGASAAEPAEDEVKRVQERPVERFVEHRVALEQRSVAFEYCVVCQLCRIDVSRMGTLCTPCTISHSEHPAVSISGERFCIFGQKDSFGHVVGAHNPEKNTAIDQSYFDAALVACAFRGVTIVPEIICADIEATLLAYFDGKDWKPSQSGRRKQDFGPSVNFKRQKVKIANFEGLPRILRPIVDLIVMHVECLEGFVPVECGVIECEYLLCRERTVHVDISHFLGVELDGR